MLKEDDNALDSFWYYKEENFILSNKKQDIEEDYIDLVSKRLDIRNVKNMFLRHTTSNQLLTNELLLFLIEFRFSKYEFPIVISISDINHNYLKL